MDRARMLQLAVALLLGGALFVETAVLFDPDLGTPVPIFHEWTCYGTLDVGATDGYGRPSLTSGISALNASAKWAGEFVPAYFIAHVKGADGEWRTLEPQYEERGWHYFVLEFVTSQTLAYVVARDATGKRCEGQSGTIQGSAEDPKPLA